MRYDSQLTAFLDKVSAYWDRAFLTEEQRNSWARSIAGYNYSRVLDLLADFYDQWVERRAPRGPDFARYLAANAERARSTDDELLVDRREQFARAGRTFSTPSGRSVRFRAGGLEAMPDGPFVPWADLTPAQQRDAIHYAIEQGGNIEARELESISWLEFLRRCAQEGLPLAPGAAEEVEKVLGRLESKRRRTEANRALLEQGQEIA